MFAILESKCVDFAKVFIAVVSKNTGNKIALFQISRDTLGGLSHNI